jgi:hypothetical protein
MGKPWTPSIVPSDQTVYLVMDDLGRLGPVWREADASATDYETVIQDMLSGQYRDPIGFSLSMLWKAGAATFPKTSHANSASAATSS